MTATTLIMTEADTCRELVTPKLVDSGWGSEPHVIGEQRTFTNRRIIVIVLTSRILPLGAGE